MKDENMSQVLRHWSATLPKSLNATTLSSSASTGDLSASQEELPSSEPSPKKRRRFSADSVNDLLFWGVQLTIVALALGIMWVKVDALARALRTILKSEEGQNQTLLAQARTDQAATIQAQQAERVRSIQFDTVIKQVEGIQADIKATLAKTMESNQLLLAQSEATKAAALQSQQAAQNAAGAAKNAALTAGSAAGAAYRAATNSSRTASTVATKVVTSSAREQLETQQRALARKQAQLTRTIREVKKNGPNLIQQIFH
jgi:hypothetical protein